MPSEATDIKQFLEFARRKDAQGARVKKYPKSKDIKLKIRCKRYLYTLILKTSDTEKLDKIKQSLPPLLDFQEIKKKNKKPKKN